MKYFLPVFICWSLCGWAQSNECSSIWVFNPTLICANPINGFNLAGPAIPVPGRERIALVVPGYRTGRQDQPALCRGIVDAYNAQNAATGTQAAWDEMPPLSTSNGSQVNTAYQYTCFARLFQFPVIVRRSAACGALPNVWATQIGGPRPPEDYGLNTKCLSCDGYVGRDLSQMVACLQDSLTQIVLPRAVEIRDSDVAALKAQIARLRAAIQTTGVLPFNFSTVESTVPFQQFEQMYPTNR